MPENKKVEIVVSVLAATVAVIIGAVMVGLGTHIYRQHTALKAGGRKTTGTIVRFERIGGQGGSEIQGTILVPVVKFMTAAGRKLTLNGSTDSNPPWAKYRTGDQVAIIYDPRHPENARIDTFAEIWFAPLLLWIIGGTAMVIPPFTIWRHIKSTSAS